MCLIIVTTGSKLRNVIANDTDMLDDIYTSNPDGLGAMYTTSKHKLRTPKILPRSLRDVQAFFRGLPADDRTVAVHFRLRTHGATSLDQCHPYTVIPGRIAMMHNGILAHGNAPDTSKSDTWHYVDGYLQPLLEAYPKAFTNIGVQNLIESDISTNNKFVFMDNDGEMAIFNEDRGIKYDGIWFSNTYAWSPEMLIPDYQKPIRYTAPSYGSGSSWWNNPMRGTYGHTNSLTPGALAYAGAEDETDGVDGESQADDAPFAAIAEMETEVWSAVSACDAEGMADLLDAHPRFTLATLFKDSEFLLTDTVAAELSQYDRAVVQELRDKNLDALVDRVEVEGGADAVAEIMLWYGYWAGTEMPTNDAVPSAVQINAA